MKKVFTTLTFHVTAKIAGMADSEFTIEVNGQTKNVKIPVTGSYENFEPLEIGTFDIKEAGNYKITFKPVLGS